MKSRSREINIFSMSALDLFASGMGAFILLAVVGLVFFPNRGDSDERVAEVKEELAEARQERDAARRERDRAQRERDAATGRLDASEQTQQELARARQELDDARSRLEAAARTDPDSERLRQERDDARSRLAEAERARQELEKRVTEARRQLKEIEIPDIDIVICLDVTGSMGDQIAGLQQQIVDLAKVLDALAPSAGVGVVAFGDRAWRRPLYVQRLAIDARDLAHEAEPLVDAARPQQPVVHAGDADGAPAEAVDLGDQPRVDDAAQHAHHHLQRLGAGRAQPVDEHRRHVQPFEPVADHRPAAVHDDGPPAATVQLDHVGERGVLAAEGGAADLDDDRPPARGRGAHVV